MRKLKVRVDAIGDEAVDIKSFRLVSDDGEPLPGYSPGSNINVHIAPGITRQYSLCGDQSDTSYYKIAVKRELNSRGGSEAMHTQIKQSDTIEIDEPKNNFPLDERSDHCIFLAGGIGITPIVSMIDRMVSIGKSFELHYFTRSRQHTAFYERLIKAEQFGHVHLHYSLEPDGVRAYLRKLLWDRRDGDQLYLCGPKPFMDLVEVVASATWPPTAVHLEYFSADPVSLAGEREGFEVTLARTGGTFCIPEDKSIIDALCEQGVQIDYSCEQGVCGTCLTGVLDGEPDHRDMFMSPDEKAANDKMCTCVSRAKSASLVLDL